MSDIWSGLFKFNDVLFLVNKLMLNSLFDTLSINKYKQSLCLSV